MDDVGTYHNDHSSYDDNEDSFIAFVDLIQSNCSSTSTWILNTEATCHLTSQKAWLKDYIPLLKPFLVRFGNNPNGTLWWKSHCHWASSFYTKHYKNFDIVNKLTYDNKLSIKFFHNYIIHYKISSGKGHVVNYLQQERLYLLGHSVAPCHRL